MITALVIFLFFTDCGNLDRFSDSFKTFLGFISTISFIMAINQDIALIKLLYRLGGSNC